MSGELEGQMALFDYIYVQPDEECDGCCICKPDEEPPRCQARGDCDDDTDCPVHEPLTEHHHADPA